MHFFLFKFADLPKTCDEAAARNLRTGELYIQPDSDLDPFLVHCEIDRFKKTGTISPNSIAPGKAYFLNEKYSYFFLFYHENIHFCISARQNLQ